jgi:hypothetical protein
MANFSTTVNASVAAMLLNKSVGATSQAIMSAFSAGGDTINTSSFFAGLTGIRSIAWRPRGANAQALKGLVLGPDAILVPTHTLGWNGTQGESGYVNNAAGARTAFTAKATLTLAGYDLSILLTNESMAVAEYANLATNWRPLQDGGGMFYSIFAENSPCRLEWRRPPRFHQYRPKAGGR